MMHTYTIRKEYYLAIKYDSRVRLLLKFVKCWNLLTTL